MHNIHYFVLKSSFNNVYDVDNKYKYNNII